MNRFYNPKFLCNTVPGMLKEYDLPDLAASLAPRQLLIINATDGEGNIQNSENANRDLDFVKTIYHFRKADAQLKIVSEISNEKVYDILLGWIKP